MRARHGSLGYYPPAPTYVNGTMPDPNDAPRERERSATRLAWLDTNHDRQNPAAVVYIAGQAVTVELRDGALCVNVLVAQDERLVFRSGDSIPIRFAVEDAPVLTIHEDGTVTDHAGTSRM